MMWKVRGGGREVRTVVRDGTVNTFHVLSQETWQRAQHRPRAGAARKGAEKRLQGKPPDRVSTAVLQHFVTRTCGVVLF